MHTYTDEEIAFITENIKGRSISELAAMLNTHFGLSLSYEQVRAAVKNRGMKSGLTGQFSKGHTPFNKGVKGSVGWPPTQFKKGHVPQNYRPVGSERVNVDGYVEIKVADPNIWRPKHVVVWEAINGPRPVKHALFFLDGNPLNTNIENLALISRSKLAVLNKRGLLQKDRALNQAALITADLILKIGEVKNRRGSAAE